MSADLTPETLDGLEALDRAAPRRLTLDDVEPRPGAWAQARAAVAAAAVNALPDLIAAARERDQLRNAVERLHSWAGLMELLDEHWPADIWPMLEDDRKADAGHRVTSAMRWIDRLKAERDEARAAVERVRDLTRSTDGDDLDPDFDGNTAADIRRALDGAS